MDLDSVAIMVWMLLTGIAIMVDILDSGCNDAGVHLSHKVELSIYRVP